MHLFFVLSATYTDAAAPFFILEVAENDGVCRYGH
jgi:hypothetical protein